MTTLNLAMIVMMIESGMLPMHAENMHIPMVYPTAKIEIVNVEIINAGVIDEEIVPSAPIEIKETPLGINQDKTYEQCMKEAFERVYAEVNRLLGQIPDHIDEQLQLRRTMQ